MQTTVGIRREDKNKWERRVPLIPEDTADLRKQYGFGFVVQPSTIRVFADEEYRRAGAAVGEDLCPASIVFAVKEIPTHLIQPGKVYVFFAHVAKGQHCNMPMLRRFMELGCSVVDYEKIVDDQKRRLIFFGRHAGYAGMVETLRAVGQRLAVMGVRTPLSGIRHAYQYEDLLAAKQHLRELQSEIARSGVSDTLRRLVFGFSGYGNVSSGAQDVFDCLTPVRIEASALREVQCDESCAPFVKVVFREEDMVRPQAPGKAFSLPEYYEKPELYASCFEEHLPYLDVLVNAIYWEPRYPRLVTRDWAARTYRPGIQPRLQVIGDISCDIEGSIEMTLRVAEPDNPCYVYLAQSGETRDGFEGEGPVIMAVDNLPCEIPKESSQYFSSVLREMVPPLAGADWRAGFENLRLPSALKRAVIVHRGELTPSFRYLQKHLEAEAPATGRP